ncbi:MAG: 16S rRNA (cytosine(967)-C(5))-methyltransferase RsmB [Candidatus Marinimicrobia bacterium]|jgi:16S rRNA (cytosine967-C5)-methyltransferase|nr:16S rRNA (cytosine(967)-C(5))-methyltransferase RsmB [Candidatus Neomarinimicrobiota bacterium]MDP6611769.1 16S rRNA (cytosine(967)-C(5))-methyltransferase RsmB [Candidatus Neomarinimicrobiota bacterium]|tara:strand:- start:103981 stop:105288 length:1308 start_codon:yes stop_codon:yes gene_type:complete
MRDARFHAFQVIQGFYRYNIRLKFFRDQYFKKHSLSRNDLSRTLVLTNEVVRWQGRLDYWISLYLDKPINKLHPSVHNILRLGYFEALMDKSIPQHAVVHSWVELAKSEIGVQFGGLVNAVLRKTEKINPTERFEDQSLNAWYSYPKWLFQKWNKQFGETKANQLCEYFNKPSPNDIRLNGDKGSRLAIVNQLEKEGIELVPSPESDRFFRVKTGMVKVLNNNQFKTGLIHAQDCASGAVVELLDPHPGENILDVCAAPGTKSGYIVEKMKGDGQVYSSDISQKRIELGNESTKALKLIIQWDCKDASKDDFPIADRILVDAPCTGTGVIGRRTDIRWRREEDDIKSLVEIQSAILNHMAQFLKQDGILVYATCSIEAEENWNVVESFLKLNDNFSLESGKNFIPNNWLNQQDCLETFPPRDRVDGMFAARLRKK